MWTRLAFIAWITDTLAASAAVTGLNVRGSELRAATTRPPRRASPVALAGSLLAADWDADLSQPASARSPTATRKLLRIPDISSDLAGLQSLSNVLGQDMVA